MELDRPIELDRQTTLDAVQALIQSQCDVWMTLIDQNPEAKDRNDARMDSIAIYREMMRYLRENLK